MANDEERGRMNRMDLSHANGLSHTMSARMEARVERVTPEIAKRYLERANPRNRCVQSLIRRYAKTMLAGLWYLHHQGIAFDESGMLIDGHHRLRAIVLSGVTVEMQVSRGVPNVAIAGMDRGATRTMQHISRMVDGAPGRHALECGRQWITIVTGSGSGVADHEVWRTAELLEPHWQKVSALSTMHSSTGRIRVGVRIGAIVISVADSDVAVAFVEDLVSASKRERLGEDGTRNLLRWLDNAPKGKGGGFSLDTAMAGAVMRAFEQFRVGGRHEHIKVTESVALQAIRDCDRLLRGGASPDQ